MFVPIRGETVVGVHKHLDDDTPRVTGTRIRLRTRGAKVASNSGASGPCRSTADGQSRRRPRAGFLNRAVAENAAAVDSRERTWFRERHKQRARLGSNRHI
jgi:hypothetical protein